jgi:hypothetical protein
MKFQFTKLFFLLSVSILIFSCKTECEHTKSDISCYPNDTKPSQVITYEEMADMMDAFDKGPKKELNKYLKKVTNGKDSVSTNYNWYKLDDLKQYIAYIERISKEKDIKVTGFRIVPSTYPKKYKVKELQNRQTLIFTPTTSINGKDDVAFEPLYSEKGKPVEIMKFLDKVRAKQVNEASMINFSFQTGLESSSANRFPPNPPY